MKLPDLMDALEFERRLREKEMIKNKIKRILRRGRQTRGITVIIDEADYLTEEEFEEATNITDLSNTKFIITSTKPQMQPIPYFARPDFHNN